MTLFTGHVFAQEEETTTITINNARQTDYTKDKESDNDCIVLTGDVQLSVVKGGVSSEISADMVTYDRKSQMLYAEGNVHIVTKNGSNGGQDATANSLIMNTSTLEGVFDGGKVIQTQSDAINLPSGSTLVVFSDVFGKSENNTIVFKNSSLTFCDDENPHWHIDASRTWLLPGGEFAFLNALLYVGPVPVFYFPAFYYPKDELIFNPNFGYRAREGYYFQTTTYLYGRKPAASSGQNGNNKEEDSMKEIYNFMKSTTLKQQERQGLVLHNLDEDYTGDTSHYIKLMADWYSNIGGMIGVEGRLLPKKLNFISSLNFNLSMGFGNKIKSSGGMYLPFDSNMQTEWYKTNFLGLELPFRYKGNLELNINKPFSINISLPLYSDPEFASDFENRNENLDWINLLTNFGNEEGLNTNSVTSFVWKISASGNIPVPEVVKSYFSTFSIQATSSMNINARKNYFYPTTVTPVNITGNISGTLYNYPETNKNAKVSYFTELTIPDEFLEEKKETTEEKKSEDNQLEMEFPVLNPFVATYELPAGLVYNLNYSLNLNFINQLNFDLEKINTPDDFDWKKIKSSLVTFKVPLSINSNFSYRQNFLNLKNSISYNPVIQSHPNVTGLSDSEKNNVLLSDYKTESQTILSTNSLTLKPFIFIPGFSDTSVSYNTNINLFRRKFIGSVENPEWEYLGPDWTDEESVIVHNFNLIFAASQLDNTFRQTFTFTANIYPQLPKFSGTLNLVFPYVTASFSTGINQKSKNDSTWVKNPFNQSVSVSLFDSKLKFSENFTYNLQENHSDSFRISASYKTFSAAYSMQYTNKYDFDVSNGWTMNPEKAMLPYSLTMNYTLEPKDYYYWFNRVSIKPGLLTALSADLVRPTNSYFTISPSLSFKINEFLTITFSSTSRNSVLYRYVQGMLGTPGRIPGEENPFIDLWDSFRFDDKTKRENSGWKLKSLNLAITHQLHDWDFNMLLKIEPRLITVNNKKTYSYNPYFSLGITWKPMESIKTTVTDDYGQWKFE